MSFFATSGRDEFLTTKINEKNYTVGIEVGVREGFFSKKILQETKMKLYGIDISILESAKKLCYEYPERYYLKHGKSPDCVDIFSNDFFDFIHIDADHSYEGVKKDLVAWWPKLKAGGCFSGDDYADTDNPGEGKYGVVQAVNEFADKNNLELFVVGVGNKRSKQLEHAKENGLQANNYLRGLAYKQFQNPCWYIIK